MEKTYLTLKDEKHMSKAKREDLQIKVFDMKEGSFEAVFQLVINQAIPSLLPMITALNAKNVWELAKSSFNYLLTILEASKNDESVSLNEVDAENVQVIKGSGNVVLNVHPDIVNSAK